MTNGLMDFRLIKLPRDRSFLPTTPSTLLGLRGEVLTTRPVPPQLATDRGGAPIQRLCDPILRRSLMPQFHYAVTLFQSKMTCHRWASVPKG